MFSALRPMTCLVLVGVLSLVGFTRSDSKNNKKATDKTMSTREKIDKLIETVSQLRDDVHNQKGQIDTVIEDLDEMNKETNEKLYKMSDETNEKLNALVESMAEIKEDTKDRMDALVQRIDQVGKDTQDAKFSGKNSTESLKSYVIKIIALHTKHTPSKIFQGYMYLVSRKRAKFNFKNAQNRCYDYGGALADITSSDEFDFVVNFLKKHPLVPDLVFTGYTDQKKEGHFINSNTGKPMSKFAKSKWGVTEPNNSAGREDCGVFFQRYDYLLYDMPCDRMGFYICKVPVNT